MKNVGYRPTDGRTHGKRDFKGPPLPGIQKTAHHLFERKKMIKL